MDAVEGRQGGGSCVSCVTIGCAKSGGSGSILRRSGACCMRSIGREEDASISCALRLEVEHAKTPATRRYNDTELELLHSEDRVHAILRTDSVQTLRNLELEFQQTASSSHITRATQTT
jgi:hypothetical protein